MDFRHECEDMESRRCDESAVIVPKTAEPLWYSSCTNRRHDVDVGRTNIARDKESVLLGRHGVRHENDIFGQDYRLV
eukprot:21387_5